jgi:hypothetical protein
MALTLADLLASPDHYLHSFDSDGAVFVPMSRAAYNRSIFLDGRIEPEGHGSMCVPLATFTDRIAPPQRTGWIFHVAHCGSTLLARALDRTTTNLILREPLALRQVALSPDPRRLALVAAMLAKRYQPDLPNVVKANVPVNFLLPQLIALDRQAPAIFLYLELQDYLLAILRSQDHRAWLLRVTQQLAGHLGDLSKLSVGQRAGALWAAQIRAYAAALGTLAQGRSLDAERFFTDPAGILATAAAHLAVPIDRAAAESVTQGPLFASYSKNPSVAFDNATRLARRRELQPTLAREIAEAQEWVERHAPEAPTALGTLRKAALS